MSVRGAGLGACSVVHRHVCIYIYIYIYVYVLRVCVCVLCLGVRAVAQDAQHTLSNGLGFGFDGTQD